MVFPLASNTWPHNNKWHLSVMECQNILWYFVSLSIYDSSHASVIDTLTKATDWKVHGLNHTWAKIFSSQKSSDLLWGPASLILSGLQGSGFLLWSVKLITLWYTVLRLWMSRTLPTHTHTQTHTFTHTHTHTLNTHTNTYIHSQTLTQTQMHTHTCARYIISLPFFIKWGN